MTDRYYDPNASGADDGTSWTDAYQLFFTALAACSASDRLFVKYGANESDSTNRDWDGGMNATTQDTPIRVYVAGNGDTAEPPTTYGGVNSAKYTYAYVQSESLPIDIISHGLDWFFHRGILMSPDKFCEFADCDLNTNQGLYPAFRVSNDVWARLLNVRATSTTASRSARGAINGSSNAKIEWIGGGIGPNNPPTYGVNLSASSESQDITVIGVDFKEMNSSSYYLCDVDGVSDNVYQDVLFRNCLLGANVNVANTIGKPGINVSLDSCDVSGGDTSRTEDHSYFGTRILDDTTYRDDGADDGDPYSFAFAPSAKCANGKYWRVPLGRVNADVSDTDITVHFCRASGKSSLTDTEIWIDAVYPDDASPIGNIVSDRNAVSWVAGTAQTTSTESWTGISTPVKQQASVTVAASAAQAGEVEVFLCLAYDGSGANDEVYVCPKVEVA